VTVFFDDGSSYAANLYSDGGLAGALAVVGLNVAAAPTIEVLNLTPPVAVSNATQTVRVTGPANGTAQLLIVEGALFEQPGGGVDIQPFEANSAIAKQEILAIALNGSGVADVPITLTRSDPDGGLNHLVAIVAGTSVQTSASLVIEYDPDLPSSSSCALVRINAGGPAFTGSDGRQWLADQEFVGGSTTTNAVSIDNTVDDTLYQSERSGAFIYEIALPNGTFDVNLMFAEIYYGVETAGGVGTRVFDVTLEGIPALTNFDILAETAPATALIKTTSNVVVNDGLLSLTVNASADSPKLSAIEIVPANGVAQSFLSPDTEALAFASQIVGTTSSPQSLLLQNLGDALDITDLQVTGTGAASFSHDGSLPINLASCDEVSIGVTFTPVGEGLLVATLEVTHTGVGSPILIALTGTGLADDELPILYRVNTGGPALASADGSTPDWSVDTAGSPSSYRTAGGASLYDTSSGSAYQGPIDMSSPSLSTGAPATLFETERFDLEAAPEMTWSFPVASPILVEVRVYLAEIYNGITQGGQRVFDVSVEGSTPASFTALDPYDLGGGPSAASMVFTSILVTDGVLDLEFLHGVQNPGIKGIEVIDLTQTVSAVDDPSGVPARTELLGAYPNPFNPSTRIAFRLAASNRVELGIYDLQGRLVRELIAEEMAAGDHDVIWDGRNQAGHTTSSGVYLYRLRAGKTSETKKIMLVK